MKKNHKTWRNYSANENGEIFGSRGRKLNPIKHHTGYLVMTVCQDGLQKQMRVHRFIWECLKGDIPDGLVINHKNGDKQDNRLDNLELVTNRENVVHAWEVLKRQSVKGEDKPQAKITEIEAKEIIQLCKENVSNKEIGMLYNLHPRYISLIRHNKRWRHLER